MRSTHLTSIAFATVLMASLHAAAQTPDIQITSPAATGSNRVRIDVNPGTSGDQVARRVPAGNFDIDITVYNGTQIFDALQCDVVFDSAAVSFVSIVTPALFGTDNFPNASVSGNVVSVTASSHNCCAGATSGSLVRLRFTSVANLQSGFDVTNIQLWYCPTCPGSPSASIVPDTTEAKAVVVIGDATISCLNVNTTGDTSSINTAARNPRSNAAFGSGEISLRSAIQIANLVSGGNRPTFRIPGGGNPTILLGSALPALSDASGATYVDGTTQPGGTVQVDGAGGSTITLSSAANTLSKLAMISNPAGPGVTITGNSNAVLRCNVGINAAGGASANADGVVVSGGTNNEIGRVGADGNVISGNTNDGVRISGAATTGTLVRNNKIGTDAAGNAARANGGDGIEVAAGAGASHLIGGAAGAGNIISANGASGVHLASNGSTVQGNSIGISTLGNALANALHGVFVDNGANNVIGVVGAAQNIIGANVAAGVQIAGAAASGNVVRNNLIGLNAAGAARPNLNGVVVSGGANNQIGGGAAGEGNVISRNSNDGVQVTSGASGTSIRGNKIGTNAAGAGAEPNTGAGVHVLSTAGSNNVVGGATALERNIISANGGNGVHVQSANNRVRGNYIGLDVNGLPLGNTLSGVLVDTTADNIIGGSVSGEGNVISGNLLHGVAVLAGASATLIRGNKIGTNPAGTVRVPNSRDGVHIAGTAGASNVIGGATATERNLISANGIDGIHLASDGNRVQGNYIGTDVNGNAGAPPMGNTSDGIFITQAANNLIGGNSPSEGNVISGNGSDGVDITGGAATGNSVLFNIIGLNAAGAVAVPNAGDGVELFGCTDNIIGSATAGNVISGNTAAGVRIEDGDSNDVQGNDIGLNQAHTAARGNAQGILIVGPLGDSSANNIGGAAAAQGNIIAGNTGEGVAIAGPLTASNLVSRNIIGTNELFTPLPNGLDGVALSGGAKLNQILDNQIRGNSRHGVFVTGPGTDDNVIQGNTIGTSSGPNQGDGVQILGIPPAAGPTGTWIHANTLRFNRADGVHIQDANGNSVSGNSIELNEFSGVLLSGADSTAVGGPGFGNGIRQNVRDGVTVQTGASGGSVQNSIIENIISLNLRDGVRVVDVDCVGNRIQANSIFDNDDLGIDLAADGVTPNDADDADAGPNLRQNFPVLVATASAVNGTLDSTANTAHTVEIFSNSDCDASGHGEGETLLGSIAVITDGNGDAAFSFPLVAVPPGTVVTATATAQLLNTFNTSEFSACVVVPAACTPPSIETHPIEQTVCVGDPVSFTVVATGGPGLTYQWRKDGQDLSDGANISGATTSQLTLSAAAIGDEGAYDAVVSSPCGQATSNPAALSIRGSGDMNCDGVLDFFDIDPFILGLFNPAQYAIDYPSCDISAGDMTCDGVLDFFDIDPFLNCLFNGCPQTVAWTRFGVIAVRQTRAPDLSPMTPK